MAIARAASWAAESPWSLVIESVSASTSVRPRRAAEVNTPAAPKRSWTTKISISTAWKAITMRTADQNPRGLAGSAGPAWLCFLERSRPGSAIPIPTTSGGNKNGQRWSRTGGLKTEVRINTRGSMTVQAARIPRPSAGPRLGTSRLRRENPSVTAVDESKPPSNPVIAKPRPSPTTLRAKYPTRLAPVKISTQVHSERGRTPPSGPYGPSGKSGRITRARTAKWNVACSSCSEIPRTVLRMRVFSLSARTTTAAAPPAMASSPEPAAAPRPSTTSAATSVVLSTPAPLITEVV